MAEERLNLPFDQYQRYRIAAEVITILKEGEKDKLRILDVGGCASHRDGGGFFLPITLFLPQEDLMVADVVDFKDPIYVKTEGGTLPFSENDFDIVLCNDVLEHIPPLRRENFINDLIRVSRGSIILATPFKTEINHLAEIHLSHFIQKRLGVVHVHLQEHIDHGLPEREEIERIIKSHRIPFLSFTAGNTYHWFIMMVLKHYIMGLPDSQLLHGQIDRFYNENFSEDFWPVEAYRCFYLLMKEAMDPPSLIHNIETCFPIRPPDTVKTSEARDSNQFFETILNMIWEFHRKKGTQKSARFKSLYRLLFGR